MAAVQDRGSDGIIRGPFAWTLQHYSTSPSITFSGPFVVAGHRWRFVVYPRGRNVQHELSVFLECMDLPEGASVSTTFKLRAMSQVDNSKSDGQVKQHVFTHASPVAGVDGVLAIDALQEWIVNDSIKLHVSLWVLPDKQVVASNAQQNAQGGQRKLMTAPRRAFPGAPNPHQARLALEGKGAATQQGAVQQAARRAPGAPSPTGGPQAQQVSPPASQQAMAQLSNKQQLIRMQGITGNLRKDLRDTRSRVKELEAQCEQAVALKQAMEERLEQQEVSMVLLKTQMAALQESLKAQATRNATFRGEVRESLTFARAERQQAHQMLVESKADKEEVQQLTHKVEDLERQKEKHAEFAMQQNKQLRKLDEAFKEEQAARRQLCDSLEGMIRMQVQEAHASIEAVYKLRAEQMVVPASIKTEQRQTKDELRQTKDELREAKDGLRQTKDELRQTKDGLRQTKDGLQQATDGLRQTKDEVQQTRDGLRQTTDKLQQTQDKLEGVQKQNDRLMSALSTQVKRLKALEDQFQEEQAARKRLCSDVEGMATDRPDGKRQRLKVDPDAASHLPALVAHLSAPASLEGGRPVVDTQAAGLAPSTSASTPVAAAALIAPQLSPEMVQAAKFMSRVIDGSALSVIEPLVTSGTQGGSVDLQIQLLEGADLIKKLQRLAKLVQALDSLAAPAPTPQDAG